jgi:hypothetical protein
MAAQEVAQMEDGQVKIYVTKWAFSDGVLLMDAEKWEGYMQVKRYDTYAPEHLRPNEWALDREGAERQVEDMRAKKISAAKRQVKRLQDFVVEWKG